MTDPDSQELFGLELKKKKKKKKNVDLSQLENEVENIAHASNELPNDKPPDAKPEVNDDPLDLSTRKKKKKKNLILEEPVPTLPTEPVQEPIPEPVIPEPVQEIQDSVIDYELPPRKKRKRQNITFEGFDDIIEMVVHDVDGEGDNDEDNIETMDTSPWAGNDRDYTYDELLERVFNIMKQKNPSMVDRKTKLVMKPPQVMRVGAKRTSFANFTEICKHLHRQPKHMLAFLMAELGTSGSVDGNNQLIIKGRFQQKQIETVLRRYIKEYVTCHTCRSPETILQRENRLVFLQCETCGSRCSVQSIQSGFQAITNKAQRRSKQQ